MQTMSAVGSSADNALAESFNATCKREILQGRRTWPDEREARLDLLRRYNTRRRHSSLEQRSPIPYETALNPTSTTLTPAQRRVVKRWPDPSRGLISRHRQERISRSRSCGGVRRPPIEPFSVTSRDGS